MGPDHLRCAEDGRRTCTWSVTASDHLRCAENGRAPRATSGRAPDHLRCAENGSSSGSIQGSNSDHLRCARTAAVSGGWLLMPEPSARPSRLIRPTSLIGSIPEIYYEALPEPGRVFRGDGGYDNPGGIFRLRGSTAADVHSAMLTIAERYELVTEPV
jgi:hypothetical protein